MNNKKLNLILIIILTIFVGSVYARTLKGIKMDETIKIGNDTLVLNGIALRKAKIFFKVYVAGLYLPAKEKDGKKVLSSDTKRTTIMHFMRKVTAKQLNDGWMDGLKANTPKASAELKKQFETLCSYMTEVKDGDRIEFTYIPNTGTKIIVKKELKGTITGKAFANALFAVWIGDKPGPGNGFKEDLLGQ